MPEISRAEASNAKDRTQYVSAWDFRATRQGINQP